MQIDVDFDVWKALTARRDSEDVSYNDVLRDLLGLGSPRLPLSGQSAAPSEKEFQSRNLVLPSGTTLRAKYKSRQYHAEIRDGRWIDEQGVEHDSPSAAARHITGTNVNGLRFWHGRLPKQSDWYPLDTLALL